MHPQIRFLATPITSLTGFTEHAWTLKKKEQKCKWRLQVRFLTVCVGLVVQNATVLCFDTHSAMFSFFHYNVTDSFSQEVRVQFHKPFRFAAEMLSIYFSLRFLVRDQKRQDGFRESPKFTLPCLSVQETLVINFLSVIREYNFRLILE